jgi:hypothetical protein
MEENRIETMEDSTPEVQEAPAYKPRPAWQIGAAWVGLAIVITGVILYYIHIARGGM